LELWKILKLEERENHTKTLITNQYNNKTKFKSKGIFCVLPTQKDNPLKIWYVKQQSNQDRIFDTNN
jgi:hypothetical protein